MTITYGGYIDFENEIEFQFQNQILPAVMDRVKWGHRVIGTSGYRVIGASEQKPQCAQDDRIGDVIAPQRVVLAGTNLFLKNASGFDFRLTTNY